VSRGGGSSPTRQLDAEVLIMIPASNPNKVTIVSGTTSITPPLRRNAYQSPTEEDDADESKSPPDASSRLDGKAKKMVENLTGKTALHRKIASYIKEPVNNSIRMSGSSIMSKCCGNGAGNMWNSPFTTRRMGEMKKKASIMSKQ
jgi:hypothetical protein